MMGYRCFFLFFGGIDVLVCNDVCTHIKTEDAEYFCELLGTIILSACLVLMFLSYFP